MKSEDRPGSLAHPSTRPAPSDLRDETPVPTATTPPPPEPRAVSVRPRSWTDPPPRRSRFSLPAFKPRWKPWTPAQVVAWTMGFAVVAGLLVAMTLRVEKRWALTTQPLTAALVLETAKPAAVAPSVRVGPVAPRADAKLSRDNRSPVAGGLLTLPPAFHSEDGAYDLVIHFHGNTDLVEESYALSGINAVVVILNLGVGSGPYEDRFANPLALPELIDRAQTTMEKRGLAHPTLRRLALSAWSAGYGAVLKVLEQPALAAKVDAVILLDGIHVGYQPHTHDLILERLAPFERFAREAVEGRKLFSITHTRIIPSGNYAGTRETTDALLRAVGVQRVPGGEKPALPPLRSLDGVIAKKLLVPLEPEDVARKGGLVIRGFTGDQPEHHMVHLISMSTTAVPDLVAWWKGSAAR